jgi:hypothetical protein
MTVRYHQRGGQRIVPDYLCARKSIQQGEHPRQRLPGSGLDRAIGALLGERVTPEALALTIAVQEELVNRAAEAQRLRHLQVERTQYEADLAQRRYLKVDPDNRLVATVLEAEWNTKLRELEEARAIEEQYNRSDQHQVSTQERAEIEEVPERFRQFWHEPKTTVRERKRAVRLLIEDVTVHKAEQIIAHIRFKGGAVQTISVALPPRLAWKICQMGEFEAIILSSVDLPVTICSDGYLFAVHGSQESIEADGHPFVAQFPNMSDMVHLNLFAPLATDATGHAQFRAGP